MSIRILVLGGGVILGLGGGGKCRFYFYGRGDFSDQCDAGLALLNLEFSGRPVELPPGAGVRFGRLCS